VRRRDGRDLGRPRGGKRLIGAAPLHYQVHPGGGPHLLLVHGMLASRAQWLANLPALARVATPVVVELLGHGRSPSPADPSAYTPGAYVEGFEAIRRELGCERWFVCGQSLGAALTLRYALERPERVVAQVFTNSNSALADESWRAAVVPAMQAMARALAERGRAAFERMPIHPKNARRLPPDVQKALVEDCALHDPAGIALTGLHTVPDSSVRTRFAETKIPTLLVCGTREARFAEQRLFAEQALPSLHVVPANAGHAVNAEASPMFDRAVAEFLRRNLDRAS
jgi:pimeloyl-ACP methyl ester carboxylesterase